VPRFGLAEQALNAIYLLASQPDIVCGEIVREKTRAVFSKEARQSSTQPSSDAADKMDSGTTSFGGLSSIRSLSQLLFLVGHIASTLPLLHFS
jgi:condensin complex subunit 1